MSSKQWTFVSLFMVLSACTRDTAHPADSATVTQAGVDTARLATARERARAAANALGADLQGKLFAALDSGGPSKAIAFCADSAQAWTARHAREGVYVRRVSLRVRNPRNASDAEEERDLRALDSLHRAGTLPGEILRQDSRADGTTGIAYMRPIMVQQRCLQCHGDPGTFRPAVRTLLPERYPADRATGYKAGDLRGMLSVRVRP